ncbi:hypothetical protein [Streptomyces sp. NPDC001665]
MHALYRAAPGEGEQQAPTSAGALPTAQRGPHLPRPADLDLDTRDVPLAQQRLEAIPWNENPAPFRSQRAALIPTPAIIVGVLAFLSERSLAKAASPVSARAASAWRYCPA